MTTSSSTARDLGPLTANDLDAVMDLVWAVSWPHRREDIDLFVRLGVGLAVRETASGQLHGVGLWWPFGADHARLGLIIVAPQAQGRGIGRRLVSALMDDIGPRTIALLATEAGYPLYRSLGFETVGSACQMQGVCRRAATMAPDLRAALPADMDAVAALDAAAFGAPRGAMLDALAAEGHVVVQTKGAQITGYGIERRFGRGSAIGPIVARSEDDAIRVLHALLRPGFVRVDCPTDASGLIAALANLDLVPAGDPSPVMVRGTWPAGDTPHRIFALSSHALG